MGTGEELSGDPPSPYNTMKANFMWVIVSCLIVNLFSWNKENIPTHWMRYHNICIILSIRTRTLNQFAQPNYDQILSTCLFSGFLASNCVMAFTGNIKMSNAM